MSLPHHTLVNTGHAVYLVDGTRTPFLKVRAKPNPLSASDLAVQAGRALLARQPFSPDAIDEVILGCVMPSADETNIARIAALRLGCGDSVPAWTVQRNCASGMQAIDAAFQDITTGRHQLILAGGTEAMSRAPLLFPLDMATWLGNMSTSKTILDKIKYLITFRPSYIKPIIALLRGLTDPIVNLSMGQTAENIAYRFGISRLAMDTFSLESHQRAAASFSQQDIANEITPVYAPNGECMLSDDGIRHDTSLEKLHRLPPFFDKPFGQVTAGNSSQVTDGAACVLLANASLIEAYHLPVLGRIVDTAWAGLSPAEMGLGPVYAISRLLQAHKLSIHDIDYWEINEAFAAQVLGCVLAMQDKAYSQSYLGLEDALGYIDPSRLNIDGGAIALGHPVGASGARIALHVARVLQRKNARYGIASLCIGGGQGGAMLIENIEKK